MSNIPVRLLQVGLLERAEDVRLGLEQVHLLTAGIAQLELEAQNRKAKNLAINSTARTQPTLMKIANHDEYHHSQQITPTYVSPRPQARESYRDFCSPCLHQW